MELAGEDPRTGRTEGERKNKNEKNSRERGGSEITASGSLPVEPRQRPISTPTLSRGLSRTSPHRL